MGTVCANTGKCCCKSRLPWFELCGWFLEDIRMRKIGISFLIFWGTLFWGCYEGEYECFSNLRVNYITASDVDSVHFYLNSERVCLQCYFYFIGIEYGWSCDCLSQGFYFCSSFRDLLRYESAGGVASVCPELFSRDGSLLPILYSGALAFSGDACEGFSF